MNTFATNLIGAFGGSTAVSRLTAAPVSTVHSWKENGIPASRLAHLKLVAEKEAIQIDWNSGAAVTAGDDDRASMDGTDDSAAGTASANNGAEIISPDREAESPRPFSATSSAIPAPAATEEVTPSSNRFSNGPTAEPREADAA
jgi:hypothetical protein